MNVVNNDSRCERLPNSCLCGCVQHLLTNLTARRGHSNSVLWNIAKRSQQNAWLWGSPCTHGPNAKGYPPLPPYLGAVWGVGHEDPEEVLVGVPVVKAIEDIAGRCVSQDGGKLVEMCSTSQEITIKHSQHASKSKSWDACLLACKLTLIMRLSQMLWQLWKWHLHGIQCFSSSYAHTFICSWLWNLSGTF